ncbi:MAG: hypothetical protein NTW59_04675, partial [Candidatus Diapherotrites archaeon]|nr:hypothetical protein [Candidatus Diapherotrites archaeon]
MSRQAKHPVQLEAETCNEAKNRQQMKKEQQLKQGGKTDYAELLGKWKYWAKNTFLPNVMGKSK